MQFSVAHWLPGRLRLRVLDLRVRTAAADKVVAWLACQDGIKAVRPNYDCASLLVEYDEAHREDIEGMMSTLAMVSLRDLKAFIALDNAPPPPALKHPTNTNRPTH